jgi:hypothetical protein
MKSTSQENSGDGITIVFPIYCIEHHTHPTLATFHRRDLKENDETPLVALVIVGGTSFTCRQQFYSGRRQAASPSQQADTQ